MDGNVEITNFNPFNEKSNDAGSVDVTMSNEDGSLDYDSLDSEFDFSFFDNIREITGYLLIHNTKIKNIRFKSLEIVRGKNKVRDRYSVFVDLNSRLERLDLSKLKGNQSYFSDLNFHQILNDLLSFLKIL